MPPMLLSSTITTKPGISSIFLFLWIIPITTRRVAAMSLAASASPSSSSSSSSSCHRLHVLLLRHGQTDANAASVIQGSSDISRLTALGRQQAAQVVQALPPSDDGDDSSISKVYVSPLTRAQETLQVIRENLVQLPPAEILPNLREIDFYDWEGRDKTYLKQNFPDAWRAWKEGTPDDLIVYESNIKDDSLTIMVAHKPLWELWERADTVWDEIFARQDTLRRDPKTSSSAAASSSSNNTILIVAHGSLGQALLGTAMGWDATHFRQYKFPNCGMAELIWDVDTSPESSSSLRPRASRWRWKWPELSDKWYTLENKAQPSSQ
eukprot:scaffold3600_cov171-Amphora_coffeaeformis.AAC.7